MTEAAQANAAEETKAPKRGVGTVACEAIKAGKTNEEALAAVKAEFPEATTSMASINWYRNHLRQEDPSIPMARALKPKTDKQVEKEQKAAARAAAKAEKEQAKADAKAAKEAEKQAKKEAAAQAKADAKAAKAAAKSTEPVDPLA